MCLSFKRSSSLSTLFEKSNVCLKIQFDKTLQFSREIKVVKNYKVQIPNIFTSSSPKFFLTIFLVKSKLSTAKKSKTTTFSRVCFFLPKKMDNFLGKSKLNFWTKNEDFEQCVKFDFTSISSRVHNEIF